MKDPAVAVKEALVTAGIGAFNATSGWSINIGQFPASPDTSILLNQSGGLSPYPRLRLNFPSVAILVRGTKNGYQAARTKMDDCCDALLGMDPATLNSDYYRGFLQQGDVVYLGQDDNSRPVFSATFRFIVEPSTGTHRRAIT